MGLKVVYHPGYHVEIGSHVFPTEKYPMILDELLARGICGRSDLLQPRAPTREEIGRIVIPEYLDDLFSARVTYRTWSSEMPVKPDVIGAQMLSCNGTLLAAETALEHGACFHDGGGFHHAFQDHAEGFCFLNDVAYATILLLERGIDRISIVDCDLHQGNGTARYFQDEERVFTFSIHQEHLYPVKERSKLDIGLDDGTSDEEYLARLGAALEQAVGKHAPRLVIYVAGADPFMMDQLGALRITAEGLARRDRMVMECARRSGCALVAVLGGGYAEDLRDTIAIHTATAGIMKEIWGHDFCVF